MSQQKYIAIDIGGTKIRYAVCLGTQLLDMGEIHTPRESTSFFVKTLIEALDPLLSKHEVAGVGVASAGPIDFKRGEIRNPANLGDGSEGWMRFEIEKDLSAKLNLPIKVDNDAALTAYGYLKHFENDGDRDLVLLTLGTGLGVGAIVDGEPVRAGQSMHPELGHFIVADEPGDYETPFESFPTLESYLSGRHFSNRVGKAIGQELTGADLLRLSEEGDSRLEKYWEGYAKRMAVAWTNLYLAYFPQKIILAGGFSNAAKQYYFERSNYWFQKLMTTRTESGMQLPKILISANSDDLPLLGAARLIEEQLSSN